MAVLLGIIGSVTYGVSLRCKQWDVKGMPAADLRCKLAVGNLMPTRTGHRAERRAPLSKHRVLEAAIGLADDGGIATLSMRNLAQALGVEAMSLYNHVASKDDLLDAVVDSVFGEIGVPVAGGDWRVSMRKRAMAVREVLTRHPWAIELMEARSRPGPATLAHHDAVLGWLRGAGFSIPWPAHA